MKIISQGPRWVKVRATFDEMLQRRPNGLLDPHRKLGTPDNYINTDGTENLMYTGAKAYYKGGGVWLISGYNPDSSDAQNLIYGGQRQ